MKASIPLRTVFNATTDLRLHPLQGLKRQLPRVEHQDRKGPALHASPLGADILSLNLTRGCAHACAYCPARAYPTYPGDGIVHLFTDNVERVTAELASRTQKPRAVYISPSTDPFPPLAEVQAESARVIDALARQDVASWVMTRGYIRPSALRVLEAHHERVKVTFGLTTRNRELQRVLEPLAAPPRMRLRQIAQLKELGIEVRIAIEPLVPGLTDTRENLESLLESLAAVGVRHVTTGYLFVRQGIQQNLVRALEAHGWDQVVLPAFQGGPVLENGSIAPARYLTKLRRQRGYSTLMALAASLGITVRINGMTNPDFRTAPPVASELTMRQMLLPMF